ncbi:MAG: hypothetical protein F4Y86_10135 [Gammaproteobacteria bacterium]|nr:hypothetical protein [Gammaproteobacteria bacterium]
MAWCAGSCAKPNRRRRTSTKDNKRRAARKVRMADFFEDGTAVQSQLFDRFESARPADVDTLSRDLADLLGARRAFGVDLPGILGWGLPGMAGITPGSETDRQQVAGYIATAIERYEPRLRNVRVEPLEGSQEFSFTLSAEVAGHAEDAVRLRIVAPRRGGGLSADVTIARPQQD